ncbi:MSCRAMM family protein [Pseudonocardia halophobica]|uniref:MSCRAMM family protein n=1 Tax=Pseudonocardia halophobica TaxID=29401 RepID=UPI003D8AB410
MIDPGLDGTASVQVAGQVRTTARPVPDATLTLTDGAGIQVARTRSAADGAFAFPGLRPGRYVLVAHRNGHRPQATAVEALPPGGVRHDGGLDLVLEPVASLRGTVRDPDTGLPVVAAAVVAVDPAGEVVASTMSEPDGSYLLEGVDTAGPLTLVVAAPGADPVARSVELGATGGEHTVDLAVQTLSTLTGTVTGGGRPLPRLPLTLHDHRGRTVAHARTDAEGTYRFEGVPAGSYTVRSATSGPQAAGIGPDDGVCHLTLAPR